MRTDRVVPYGGLQGCAGMYFGGALVLAAATGKEACYLALGVILAAMAPSWYRRRHALTRPDTSAWSPAPAPISPLTGWHRLWVAVGAVDLVFATHILDVLWRPPVLLTMLTLAVVLAAGRHLMAGRSGVTPAHWAVYGLVALSAAGPLFGWGRGEAVTPYALTIAGLALVVTGIVDHQRPASMSGPATETAAGAQAPVVPGSGGPHTDPAIADLLLHEPASLSILSALAGADAEPALIQRILGLPTSHLWAHLLELQAGGLVTATTVVDNHVPRTTLAITAAGREAHARHRTRPQPMRNLG